MYDKLNNNNYAKQIAKTIFVIFFTIALIDILSINSFATTTASSSEGLVQSLQAFQKEYGFYFNIFLGFVVMSNLLIFVYHFIKLGATSSNPQQRAHTLQELFIAGVCLALIGGGATAYYVIFYIVN